MSFVDDLSLRKELIGLTAVTGGVALLVACIAWATYDALTVRGVVERQLATTADIAARNTVVALRFEDRRAAIENLGGAGLRPAHHPRVRVPGERTCLRLLRAPLETTLFPPRVRADGTDFSARRLTVFRPIVSGSDRVGTLMVETDLSMLYEHLRRSAAMMVALLLGSGLLSILLSASLQRAISDPILDLSRTAERISGERNYSRAGPAPRRRRDRPARRRVQRDARPDPGARRRARAPARTPRTEVEARTAELRPLNAELSPRATAPRRPAGPRASSWPT